MALSLSAWIDVTRFRPSLRNHPFTTSAQYVHFRPGGTSHPKFLTEPGYTRPGWLPRSTNFNRLDFLTIRQMLTPHFSKIRSRLTPYWWLRFVLLEFSTIKTIVSFGRTCAAQLVIFSPRRQANSPDSRPPTPHPSPALSWQLSQISFAPGYPMLTIQTMIEEDGRGHLFVLDDHRKSSHCINKKTGKISTDPA